MTKKSALAEIKSLTASSITADEAGQDNIDVVGVTVEAEASNLEVDGVKTNVEGALNAIYDSAKETATGMAETASDMASDVADAVSSVFEPSNSETDAEDADEDTETSAILAESATAITPEIDGFEGTLVGEAVRKEWIPGQLYFDYRNLLNKRIAKAQDPEERRSAIFNTQVWLLQQCYEVVEPSGDKRPLGLDDVDCMDAETLAFTVADLVSVDVTINFLDEKNSLETSELFEITEKAERYKVRKLSVNKAIEIQELSREDPTGVKLSQWLITQRIELNNQLIKLEDFKKKLDFASTVVLVQKADFLLQPYLQKKRSFTIRDTRNGAIQT